MERIPTAKEWNDYSISLSREREQDLEQERSRWNQMAPGYAGKRRRGGYLCEFLDRLSLNPDESVLDFGCGPGVLTVPLAQSGHNVVSVDFSDGMLAELAAAVESAGVGDKVQTFRRAWQEEWDGIPVCDVAIASRSLTTADVADAVAKLESKARSRVAVSVAAGEIPWCDLRVWRMLGREIDPLKLSSDLIILVNYLFAAGRMPRVDYIVTSRPHQSDDEAELRSFMRRSAEPKDEREEALLEAFLDEHIVPRPGGGVQTDYEQRTCWAMVTWSVRDKELGKGMLS